MATHVRTVREQCQQQRDEDRSTHLQMRSDLDEHPVLESNQSKYDIQYIDGFDGYVV